MFFKLINELCPNGTSPRAYVNSRWAFSHKLKKYYRAMNVTHIRSRCVSSGVDGRRPLALFGDLCSTFGTRKAFDEIVNKIIIIRGGDDDENNRH